jgi:hypothetical protein
MKITCGGTALFCALAVAMQGACAAGGSGGGGSFGDDSDASSAMDTGMGVGDGTASNPDTGSTEGADTGDMTLDSGSVDDTGSGTPDTGGGCPGPTGGACSLLATTDCMAGAECCIQSGAIACACQSGTSTTTCSMTANCAAGYACAIAQGSTTGNCYPWCIFPCGSCPAGKTCQNLFQSTAMAAGVNYGVCM